jgi:hypothetical protein
VEDVMVNAVKIISLPLLFILPWLWMKLSNGETLVQQVLTAQPALIGILLLPGIILSTIWLVNQLKR